jgi:hypothetical protein
MENVELHVLDRGFCFVYAFNKWEDGSRQYKYVGSHHALKKPKIILMYMIINITCITFGNYYMIKNIFFVKKFK